MHDTQRAARRQHSHIQKTAAGCNSFQIFDLLTSDLLFDKVESLLPEHRERQFPPTETLSMFLSQVMNSDRSCQQVVNQAAVARLEGGLGMMSVRTGGYCRARKRLPTDMIASLTRYIASGVHKQSAPQGYWHDRRVKIVDGTTVTMPDTLENQAVFPQQRNQKPSLGFPICRIVGVTCLSTGMLLEASIGPFKGKGGNERCLLRQLTDTFESGDILLGDAFFPSYFLITTMLAKGVDIVMQQNGVKAKFADFRRGKRIGVKGHLLVVDKPKVCPDWMTDQEFNAAPDTLTVRECYVGGKVLVTTLCSARKYPKKQLKELYQARWNIELDIRHIKTTMGMNTLSCKTPEMALKEIWVHLLAYNLIRLLMAQSAVKAGILPRQLSFKHCLQLWLQVLSLRLLLDEHHIAELCRLMAQQQVGNRPGRVEPRAVKRRPKPQPLLMKSRDVLRKKIQKCGHPVRLK